MRKNTFSHFVVKYNHTTKEFETDAEVGNSVWGTENLFNETDKWHGAKNDKEFNADDEAFGRLNALLKFYPQQRSLEVMDIDLLDILNTLESIKTDSYYPSVPEAIQQKIDELVNDLSAWESYCRNVFLRQNNF